MPCEWATLKQILLTRSLSQTQVCWAYISGWGIFFSAKGYVSIYYIIHRTHKAITLKISLLLRSPTCNCLSKVRSNDIRSLTWSLGWMIPHYCILLTEVHGPTIKETKQNRSIFVSTLYPIEPESVFWQHLKLKNDFSPHSFFNTVCGT